MTLKKNMTWDIPHPSITGFLDYVHHIVVLLSTTECPLGGGIRQTEIQAAEPYVPEPSISEIEVAIEKLKRHKLPGADKIPAELIQHYILRSINLKKNCPTSRRNQLSYLFTKSVIKLSVVIIRAHHCCQLHTKFYPTFFSLG
jgi:hypothetical protein